VGGGDAGEDLGAGVPEGVVAAYGDDGFVRGEGGEEVGIGGGSAAVVADLEEGDGVEAVGEHGALAGGFGVAFEEGGGFAVLEMEDEGVVVDGGAGVRVGGVGGEDAEGDAAEGESVSGAEVADADVEAGGEFEEGGVRRGDGVDADPELGGVEVAQDGGHAAHVIAVSVGEGDGVEMADVAGPEVGGDDLFADVEAGGRGGGAGRGAGEDAADWASGVDEEGAAFGTDDEEGVALADVDGGDFEGVGGGEGSAGPEDSGGDEGEDGEREGGAEAAGLFVGDGAADDPCAEEPAK